MEISEMAKDWEGKRILVAGDGGVDIYQEVTERDNPDGTGAPAWIASGRSQRIDGMAFAVASMVEGLGGEPLRAAMIAQHVTRYHDPKGKHLARSDDVMTGLRCMQKAAYRASMLQLDKADAVVICDHGKKILADDDIKKIIKAAQEKSAPVLIDPRRDADWRVYNGATCIKGNFSECGGRALAAAEWVVVTDGANGMCLMSDRVNIHYPTIPRDGDPVGCGDMVSAVLSLCLAAGIPLTEACHAANIAAGKKMAKRGARPISLGVLLS